MRISFLLHFILITISSAIKSSSFPEKNISSSDRNILDTPLKYRQTQCTAIKDQKFTYAGLDINDPAEIFHTCFINPQKSMIVDGEFLKVNALLMENLTTLPSSLISQFPNLSLIKIMNSKFVELSICTSRLKIVLLHNVSITHLNLDNCTRLTHFEHVNSSSIEYIDANEFSKLAQLTHLSLSNNRIEILPKGILYSLKKLTFLYLNDNRLRKLDGDLIKFNNDLLYIDISGNPITEIESNFFTSENLKIIDMRKVKCYSNPSGSPINWLNKELVKEKCKLKKNNGIKWKGLVCGGIFIILIIGVTFTVKKFQEKSRRLREIESYNNFL